MFTVTELVNEFVLATGTEVVLHRGHAEPRKASLGGEAVYDHCIVIGKKSVLWTREMARDNTHIVCDTTAVTTRELAVQRQVGQVTKPTPADKRPEGHVECPKCDGTGKFRNYSGPCNVCRGSGHCTQEAADTHTTHYAHRYAQ